MASRNVTTASTSSFRRDNSLRIAGSLPRRSCADRSVARQTVVTDDSEHGTYRERPGRIPLIRHGTVRTGRATQVENGDESTGAGSKTVDAGVKPRETDTGSTLRESTISERDRQRSRRACQRSRHETRAALI